MHRRRPWVLVVAPVLAGLAAVAAVLVTVGSTSREPRVRHAAAAPALALASGRGLAGNEPAPGTARASEASAVRQLIARGLPLYCGGRAKRMVALTFDDGPGPYTNLAVKKLHEFHLVATFFLVGKEIRAWPRRVGMEKPVAVFGDHTMTHPFLPALPARAMAREISRAQSLIEHATREPVLLFRPPYEGRTPAIDREVRRLGMLEVLWNVDSQDSLGADYAGIERNVLAGLKPGSIILMHENHGQTIRALPVIFAALRRDRLRAVTVPELVFADPPSPRQLRAGVGGCAVTRRLGNGG